MVAYAELTDVAAVERALEEFDRLGRHAFLQKYGYGEAREYFLVTESGRYDSKAIFAAAYEYQHGIAVSNDEIHGGRGAAASRLADLGFDIEGLDDSQNRRTFATFDEALAEFRIPLENMSAVRDFLSQHRYREFYIPRSRTYIAGVPYEGDQKAFFHSGYIWHRVGKGVGQTIELPVNRLRDGGGSRNSKAEARVSFCPDCSMQLPASGACAYC
ncbi:hypothetical protein QE428_000075 [Microbacterium sp. SORGH_AS 505]|uniref:hypothetical protein n=1 Tax=Microbacterium sp. SORGH_AS_0505 TaxID=3041770 RepID=UPI00277DDA1D|nr:hypothetical protein [Microbacterium sp. SORGH_AS_0505]MDQ1125042.1 hypothetical protein [Microbacterium sp. SORGH_AS_0505]